MPQQTEQPPVWQPLSAVELVQRQLEAVDRWNVARRASEEATSTLTRTREARLDRDRLLGVVRREHEAIVARTQQQLETGAVRISGDGCPRAVVAHRNTWFAGKVCDVLEEQGVQVVARLENGADAVGTCIAEQPDLLLVEDSLPMLSGAQVVRKVTTWSPDTVAAAHVGHDAAVAALLEAGARTAWTRRVPPADVGLQLSRLVVG